MKSRIVVVGLFAVCSIMLAAHPMRAQTPPENDPLFIRLMAVPSPAKAAVCDGGGRKHSAYEVYLANMGKTPMILREVDIAAVREGRPTIIESDSGARLASMLMFASGSDKPHDPTLAPGEAATLFAFPELTEQSGIPQEFETAITVKGSGEQGGSGTIHTAGVSVAAESADWIEAPVRGKYWLAANGPSNTSDHRRAVILFGGHPYIGQRYAIDWVQYDDTGNTFRGDQHSNASYYAWNQEIRAVADGKIVAVKDGIAENVPQSSKLGVEISDETVAGNYIIEEFPDRRYAAYAHLRPGTLKVKVGDAVKAGDVIARLGNTGNSSEPHLHFQVCDAPSFLKSEGLPFAIKSFVQEDYKLDKSVDGKQRLVVSSSHQMAGEEPMENELDTFGTGGK